MKISYLKDFSCNLFYKQFIVSYSSWTGGKRKLTQNC